MNIGYTFNWTVITDNTDLLLKGIYVSIKLFLITEIIGIIIGVVSGTGRLSKIKIVSWIFRIYIEIFRAIPILIQIFWFYYCLPFFFDIRISTFMTGIISLSLFIGAYMGEVFRSGIKSIHKGQTVAAKALGMSYLQIMRYIILPQAVRRMIPPLVSKSVDLFKATALVATIGIQELMYQGMVTVANTFRSIEIYSVIAIIYFIIAYPIMIYSRSLERKLGVYTPEKKKKRTKEMPVGQGL